MKEDESTTYFQLRAKKDWNKLETSPVAFFSAEYALDEHASMYAGGLGVLSADFLLEAADQGMPFVAVGLKYGTEEFPDFDIVKNLNGNGRLIVEVLINGRSIRVGATAKYFGESAILILLSTNVDGNTPEDKALLDHIYDLHFYIKLSQQIVFGIAGVKMLHALGITPSIYHLNEGHTAFVALALIAEKAKKDNLSFNRAAELMREKIVMTKHTILSESGLYIRSRELIEFIGHYSKEQGIDPQDVFKMGMYELDNDTFSTTKFALMSSLRQSGVSILHTIFEKERHPHSLLIPITNGIFKKRWRAPLWPEDVKASDLSDEDLWRVKCALRRELIEFAKKFSGVRLNPKVCTIVWARRFAAYKRPDLLFSDITRLKRLVSSPGRQVQFIIAGKAHEADESGRRLVEHIKMLSTDDAFKGSIAYVPDYSVVTSKVFVQGGDVWLNTPIRGKEACGTSGMKAGLNGTLELSIADGWMGEVDWEGKGWVLPEHGTAEFIYDVIEGEIVPLFYDRDKHDVPNMWAHRMRATMDIIESRYGTERMLRDYAGKLYGIKK